MNRQTTSSTDAPSESTAAAASAARRAPLAALSAWLALAALLAVGGWTYWTTLADLLARWGSEPDYSHGFLAPVVAVGVLYLRRDRMPTPTRQWSWCGVALIGAAMGLKYFSAWFYLDAADYWSLALWVAGAVTLWCGPRVLCWSWPALVFLLLAMPLPFQVEHFLSAPLQGFAARGSAVVLQTLGLAAFAEGNVILMAERTLEVERACAGLRILVGVLALTVVAAALSRQPWPVRLLLVACAAPVALLANIARIVATALCFQFGPAGLGDAVAHDAAGWVMIPLAVALIAAVAWYLSHLIVETNPPAVRDVVRRQRRS